MQIWIWDITVIFRDNVVVINKIRPLGRGLTMGADSMLWLLQSWFMLDLNVCGLNLVNWDHNRYYITRILKVAVTSFNAKKQSKWLSTIRYFYGSLRAGKLIQNFIFNSVWKSLIFCGLTVLTGKFCNTIAYSSENNSSCCWNNIIFATRSAFRSVVPTRLARFFSNLPQPAPKASYTQISTLYFGHLTHWL